METELNTRRPDVVAGCTNGHVRPADQPDGTPCPWPECSDHMGNTQTSPGVAEFPIGRIVHDGVEIGEIIGTFWREAMPSGWNWRLLGTRERLRPKREGEP
jgi:hypothetical protein